MVLEKLDITCKEMNVDPYLIPYTKINSNWIIKFKKNLKFREINLILKHFQNGRYIV